MNAGNAGWLEIEAFVQPLQLMLAPQVFAKVAKLAEAIDESESLESREVAAINGLSSGAAKALAKARLLFGRPPGPTFKLQVSYASAFQTAQGQAETPVNQSTAYNCFSACHKFLNDCMDGGC